MNGPLYDKCFCRPTLRSDIANQLVRTLLEEHKSITTYEYTGFVIIMFVALELVKHCIVVSVRVELLTIVQNDSRIFDSLLKISTEGHPRIYNYLLSAEDNKRKKIQASRDKEVNMARDSNDTLVCCIENMAEDRIIDSGASFYATYCKEELDRFKLRSGWTLKDVRYILGLKRRFISVGQLDEEGYYIGFRDQQWKVTKGSLVVARGSMYMVEVHSEGIGAIINGSGSAAVWFREEEESFLHNVSEDKETAETALGVANGIVMLKIIPETPLQFSVAERLSRTFRAKCTRLRAEAQKIGGMAKERYKSRTLEARSAIDSSSLTKPIRKSQVVLVDIPENDSIVIEHGLSSEITQSPEGGFGDSIGTKIHQRVQGSSKWKKAINEEMISLEKNQTCSLVRISAGKKASQRLWMFKVKEEQDGSKRYKARLVVKGFQQKQELQEPSYVGALNDTSTQHKSEGFQLAGQKENLEYRLKEILYGLIQAPRLLYLKFDSFTQRAWYKRCVMDYCSDMAEFNKPKWWRNPKWRRWRNPKLIQIQADRASIRRSRRSHTEEWDRFRKGDDISNVILSDHPYQIFNISLEQVDF
ncbi:retrovirus-related pol polyprotein from transposon TNT 1-94 [Tanacetum coccineum]|uniref:Retrovirus-related pol polyprotein from transposon TNT 1-94 n=1 Tax=Tanacetum coccineum TaxID=301880 RepID=A0ABQ4XFH8_9ASTR